MWVSQTAHGEAVRVRPAQGLVYVNGELVARRLLAAAARAAPRPVLLDCAHLAMLDYAAMQVRALYNLALTPSRLPL